MKKGKSNFLISIILILIAIIFTILVKVVDVQPIGVNETNIGFAKINMFVFNSIGVNMTWYHITDLLGLVTIFTAMIYAIIGGIQLIKRKSLFKVDKEIIMLGIFYIAVIAIYVLFEKVIINYRPILMNGCIEASYPSSHTLMTTCLCGSFIIINKKLFKNKISKVINIVSAIVILVTVIGRLVSGVHWFTDIMGGIIISIALLSAFYSAMEKIREK